MLPGSCNRVKHDSEMQIKHIIYLSAFTHTQVGHVHSIKFQLFYFYKIVCERLCDTQNIQRNQE